MSHFAVLVVSDSPDEDTIAKMLAPYHEFECTGIDDEYVVEVDITDQAREIYDNDEDTRMIGPNGEDLPTTDGRFWRPPTPEEQRDNLTGRKVFFEPDGWTKVKRPIKNYETFRQWVQGYYGIRADRAIDGRILTEDKGKYGYVVLGDHGKVVKVVDRTNPNAKWDWWVIGGRFSGEFALGYDPSTDTRNQEICFICGGTGRRDDKLGQQQRLLDPNYTCNGCDGKGYKAKFPTEWVNHGNQIRAGAIDWDRFIAGRQKGRGEAWDNARAAKDKHIEAIHIEWLYGVDPDKVSRQEYVNSVESPFTLFAILDDKGWTGRGSMGWWAVVTNEQDETTWERMFADYLRKLIADHPDKWLTVVDCHI